MNCRRSGIMKFMFDVGATPPQSNGSISNSAYWVDGKMLQRFLSCEDELQDILGEADDPILNHKVKIYDHLYDEGLHPRDARQGKLLNKKSFIAYLSLLKIEKELIFKDKGVVDPKDVNTTYCDIIISKNKNLKCNKCAKEYQAELREKVEKFKLMKELYYKLDPASDVQNLVSDNSEQVYAISRTFVTNFRKFVLKLMKEAAGMGSNSSNRNQVLGIGLDAFDIEDLLPWLEDDTNNNEEIDPEVNSKILCE